MKRLAAAVLSAGLLLLPFRTLADDCKPACSELPALERELFDQEFLQERFQKYFELKIIPSPGTTRDENGRAVPENMIEAMQSDARAALDEYHASPAGGGTKGHAEAAAGTADDCSMVLYVPNGKDKNGKTKYKTVPLDEKAYRKTQKCAIADFLLEHEKQHVADCKAGLKIHEDYSQYAASDVRAYGAGVRMLRHRIAETAHRCSGWESSMDAVRPNKVDKQLQETVPTPKDVEEILAALKSKKGKAK